MDFFRGKTVLVTGAAHGVGKCLALLLKDSGCNLILLDNDKNALGRVISEHEFSSSCMSQLLDLSRPETIEPIIQDLLLKFKTIDILINNAGVSNLSPIEQQSLDDILWITNVNQVSPMEISRLLVPGMKRNGYGHLVFVGSAAGIQGFPNKSTYSASKFALRGFAESLQTELNPFGIHVTTVFPGPIKTHMLDRSRIAVAGEKEKIQKYLLEKGDAPEKVASKILHAIIKRKSILLVSGQSKILWLFKRLMPVYFSRLIGKYQDRLPA